VRPSGWRDGWFTEDTLELKQAKTLLDELAS
jgi:hypothetical protein